MIPKGPGCAGGSSEGFEAFPGGRAEAPSAPFAWLSFSSCVAFGTFGFEISTPSPPCGGISPATGGLGSFGSILVMDGMLGVHWILHFLTLSLGQEEVPKHLDPGVF